MEIGGEKVSIATFGFLEGFNKIKVYRDFLCNPKTIVKDRFNVGGLKVEERLLAYVITWMLTFMGINHAQLFVGRLNASICLQGKGEATCGLSIPLCYPNFQDFWTTL
ncbi:hypothetical protein CR513_47115, partial [Mucuna pruriens]